MFNFYNFLLQKRIKEDVVLSGNSPDDLNISDIFNDIDYVPLPSEGVLYPNHQDKIKVRKINFTDENLLSKENLYLDNLVWEMLINNVIDSSETITYDDLLAIDRDAILVWLRLTSFGSDYPLTVVCPACYGKEALIRWDLKETTYGQLEEADKKTLSEFGYIPYKYNDSIIIGVTIPNMGKIKKVDELVNQLERNTNIKLDSTRELLYVVSHIEEDGGEVITEVNDIYVKLLELNLKIPQMNALKKIGTRICPSISNSANFKCTQQLKNPDKTPKFNEAGEPVLCNYAEEGIDLIMRREFFRETEAGS